MKLVHNGAPYVVYKEGSEGIGGGDFVLRWFDEWCAYRDFGRCNLVRATNSGDWHVESHGWHHPGALDSDIVKRYHQLFGRNCRCSRVRWRFPLGRNRHIMNEHTAIKLARTAIHVLIDVHHQCRPRHSPLVSTLGTRKANRMREYQRYVLQKARRAVLYPNGALSSTR